MGMSEEAPPAGSQQAYSISLAPAYEPAPAAPQYAPAPAEHQRIVQQQQQQQQQMAGQGQQQKQQYVVAQGKWCYRLTNGTSTMPKVWA
jgi:hypothetical protein